MKKSFLPILLLILTTGVSIAQTHTLKVVVPDTVQACFASGSFCSWASPAENRMTKISDSPKTFTLGITVAEGDVATSEYKYFAGPDWAYEPTDATNLKLINLDADGDTVNSFKKIWDPGLEKDVTIDVLVPVTVYQLNLTGGFNGWNPTANPMTQIDSTVNGKEFSITIHSMDTTTLEYKFVAGPGWAYEQTQSTNYKYMVDGGTVVCDAFKAIFDPTKVGDVTINITVPAGTYEVFVVGSYNNWDIDNALQATKNLDGTYTVVITQVQNLEYKCVCHRSWSYEEATAEGGTIANRVASFETGPVFNITVANWKLLWTSIKDMSSSNYRFYTLDGTIVVEGVHSAVSVYDLTGRMIERSSLSGTFVSKNLKSGIYILRIDNEAHKIFVQ